MKTLSSAGIKGIFLVILATGFNISVEAQIASKDLRKQAEQYYQLGQYEEAASVFEIYCPGKQKDAQAWFWWAECQFKSNDLEGALESLQHLENESKRTNPDVVLLLAKTMHQKHEFGAAIKYYKQFLALGLKDGQYQATINDVKRCAAGLKHNYISDDVLIENMGTAVNSKYDDFAPIESPNINSRIYFSSIRALRVVDEFADDGSLKASTQGLDCDMFGTEIINGAWSQSEALNPQLNTAAHEILQDFSEDGMVAIFTRGTELNNTDVWTDSVQGSQTSEEGSIWSNNPFPTESEIRGIYFFSDSSVIFSSNKEGGLGGYDLYLARKKSQGWSTPVNLGESVNSQFNEVTPYICGDGRTIIFSSDRLTSMGGYDIFECSYNERSHSWNPVQNLGRPINSAGNDLFYRMASDGRAAYFSSDRKSGLGNQDIYSAYFKEPFYDKIKPSIPALFTEVRDFQLFSESMVQNPDGVSSTDLMLATFDMPYLLYREDQIITPQNLPKLQRVLGLLKTYPHITLEIISHSDQTAVSNFDLYFAIKRAEQVADYLVEMGFKSKDIYLKGLGGNYPVAVNEIYGKDNQTGRFYNRRIDFRIHSEDQLPLKMRYERPEIVQAMQDSRFIAYEERITGLSYRIEFAVLDQLYKGDLVGRLADSMIEKNHMDEKYSYCSGLFQSFNQALEHLGKIKDEGHTEARIVPYLAGIRLKQSEISEAHIQEFPDLKNYLLYLN